MLTFYVICVGVGVVFALMSFVFSGFFEAHTDAGADGQFGGDVSHDMATTEIHFPLFSPLVLATFVTSFGAGGAIGLYVFSMNPLMSLIPAVVAGVVVATLAGLFVMKITKMAHSNSVTKTNNIIGLVAEVSEPIPENGVGEIVYSGKASRISGPARSESGNQIPRHSQVKITKVVGGIHYVEKENSPIKTTN